MNEEIKKRMNNILTPNKTSACLYIDFAKLRTDTADTHSDEAKRLVLLYDLYIKARSYAILNKISFFCTLSLSILVLIWPLFFAVADQNNSLIQTTITGLAAFSYASYSHYKKRQMAVENIMRYVTFTQDSLSQVTEYVIKEMGRIDVGFGFNQKSNDGDNGEKPTYPSTP